MKKKTLACLLLLAGLLISAAVPAQASAKSNAYKAYRTWIRKGAKDTYGEKYTKFCLANIDADNVPELVAAYPSEDVTSLYILSYKKGKLVHLSLASGVASIGGYRGNAYYLPGKGRLMAASVSSGTGEYTEDIYRLTAKGFSTWRQGSYNMFDDSAAKYWNGKKVTTKKYKANLKKAFSRKKAVEFTTLKYVGKTVMLKKLS